MPAHSSGAVRDRSSVVGHAQHELLAHHQVLRVAAVGHVLRDAVGAAVGAGVAFAARLLFALAALVAGLAAVHHAADGHGVAGLVAGDRGAHLGHAADDLVAGHDRIGGPAPVVAGHVQVRVADAAVENLQRDVVRAQGPAFEIKARQWRGRMFGGITDRLHQLTPVVICPQLPARVMQHGQRRPGVQVLSRALGHSGGPRSTVYRFKVYRHTV